jgi:MYXO-CTERM domain-containing protein
MRSPLSSRPVTRWRSRLQCAGVLCSVLGFFAWNAPSAFAVVVDAGAPDAAPPDVSEPDASAPDAGATDAGATDAAAPETTFPERPNGLFPICASEQDVFCIESATKDDADILHSSYVIGASFLDANSVNWSVGAGSQYGELPVEDLASTFRFVIRTGDLQPLYTYAIADHFHLSAGGDAHDGYRITIEATPSTINWNFDQGFSCTTVACGDDQTQATPSASRRSLSGNTQNMALWDESERSRFGGTYVATNAQALSTVVLFAQFPTPRWYLDVANPHLDKDGNPATGSFTAWVPPSYFEALGTTASTALEAGFEVTRTEGGVDAPLTATITLDEGGTLVRVDSVSYSAPRITVAQSTDEGGESDPDPAPNPDPDPDPNPDPDPDPGASGSGGSSSDGEGASGSGGSAGSGSAGTGSVGASGSGSGGSVGDGASGSGWGGSSSGGYAGSSTGSGGAAGSGAAPTPDVTVGSGGSSAAPSTGRKRTSSGCALGAPSPDPTAALAAAGLLALLGTRRRARSARRH